MAYKLSLIHANDIGIIDLLNRIFEALAWESFPGNARSLILRSANWQNIRIMGTHVIHRKASVQVILQDNTSSSSSSVSSDTSQELGRFPRKHWTIDHLNFAILILLCLGLSLWHFHRARRRVNRARAFARAFAQWTHCTSYVIKRWRMLSRPSLTNLRILNFQNREIYSTLSTNKQPPIPQKK